jgi:PncC family amidohydrolase
MAPLSGRFPLDDDELATSIGEALVALSAKLAVAETTAGGLISARLLSVPGASRWFERGIVPYTGTARRSILDTDTDILRTHGAVSPEAVADMVERLRTIAEVDYAIGESGIAGPQGSRRSPKPIGSVVMAVTGPAGTVSEERVFPGSRAEVMVQISDRTLEMLLHALRS